MRLSRILLALPIVLAAPAAANHVGVGQAALDLCLSLNFAPNLAVKKSGMCQCAAEAWEDRPPGYSVFLTTYMHFYETSRGDVAKTEGLVVQQMGMVASDVQGQGAIMRAELANVALACLEK